MHYNLESKVNKLPLKNYSFTLDLFLMEFFNCRFPCCGRLYPCDLCHDEKEDDHDMKYASRMVCGFCSKEQVLFLN